MNAGRIPGTLAGLLAVVVAIGAGGSAHSSFTGWTFVSYVTDDTAFAVIDVYARFDDSTDTVLNVFNSMISTSTGVEFHHNDFNTLGGLAGAWNVVQSANIPGVVDASRDSFVLIGGLIGGTNTTALDPSFDPSTGGTVATNGSWFNSNPPNLQGRVDPATLLTWVARFVIERPDAPVTLNFAANLGYNQGLGTPAQFAYDNGQGSGPMSVVPFNYLPPCDSDIDGNGLVNAGDLGKILGEWGDPCCGSDIDGDGDVNAADIAALLADWGTTCEPVIESISPDSVLAEGGAEVAITGRHLAAATSVSIGGSDAAIVSTSADGVVVTAPPGTPGPAEVVVTTPFGEQTLSDAFVYLAPLSWATVLESSPDPKVIADPEWRDRIIATGLPWRVRDNASQIEMLLVPPGTFMMGCSPSDQYACDPDENPVHEVTLTQAFYLGRYEVTQAQWTAVMGSNPSFFQSPSSEVPANQVPNRPVEQCGWHSIQSFETATGLRLPTEAEWEYACRAGTQTAFNRPPDGTNDDGLLGHLAWIDSNSASQTRPVGQKQANNLGLHDMHGNVGEWAQDWYGSYPSTPQTDPTGPISGTARAVRGGVWSSGSGFCRASARPSLGPIPAVSAVGFRAARFPYVPEICDNGLDDDGDGLVDCDDPDCASLPVCGGGWATVLEVEPDPTVITDPEWRDRIIATGLPWRVRDNASQIEMLLVPPGTFMMGCSPSNQFGCNTDEFPFQEVTLTQAFYLGRYEVTQAQWTAVMGSNPSVFQSPSSEVPAEQVPFRPVERVSWNTIQSFETATGLRLPTEAEWEYACRAGTQTAFNLPPNGTNDDGLLGQLAWLNQNAASQTRPVGQKQANNLGLHDLHGNEWEWVEDWYGSYPSTPQTDPPGPISGTSRVLRGGSFGNFSGVCRASNRDGSTPGSVNVGNRGFRAARTP